MYDGLMGFLYLETSTIEVFIETARLTKFLLHFFSEGHLVQSIVWHNALYAKYAYGVALLLRLKMRLYCSCVNRLDC